MKKLFLLLFFIITNTCYSHFSNSYVIIDKKQYNYTNIPHLDSALYYASINLHEVGGNNLAFSNKYFEKKIIEQGWRKTYSWCAYAIKTFMTMAKAKEPTGNGLAISFIKKNSVSAKDVKYGKVKIGPGWLAIWKHGDTYKGHIGIVYLWNIFTGYIVEGNTGPSNSGSQSDASFGGEFLRYREIQPRNHFRIVAFTQVKY